MRYGPQDPPETVQPDDIYISECTGCLCPLKPPEISHRVIGCIVNIRDPLDIRPCMLDYCDECIEKVFQSATEEISEAIKRMEEMKENGK